MNQLLLGLQISDTALSETLKEKEALEESLSCFGNVHFIHKTFEQAKAHLRSDTNKYKRDKEKIRDLLHRMIEVFRSDKLYCDPHALIKSDKKQRSLSYL